MARLTATEAARSFSAVLSRVAEGEEIEITRNGAVVALLRPPKSRVVTASRFRELMATMPPVDEDFAEDVRRARAELGPPDSPWPS